MAELSLAVKAIALIIVKSYYGVNFSYCILDMTHTETLTYRYLISIGLFFPNEAN